MTHFVFKCNKEDYLPLSLSDTERVDALTAAEFAMNNAINASTGVSPFFMTLGRHLRVPTTFNVTSCNVPAAAAFVKRLQAIYKSTEDNMLQT
jgi:hypothetical protein